MEAKRFRKLLMAHGVCRNAADGTRKFVAFTGWNYEAAYELFKVKAIVSHVERKEEEAYEGYKEILVLDEMLSEAEIPHILRRCFDGWQVCYPMADLNRVVSVIEHRYSYGQLADLLEMRDHKGDITGHLTAKQAFEAIKGCWEREIC